MTNYRGPPSHLLIPPHTQGLLHCSGHTHPTPAPSRSDKDLLLSHPAAPLHPSNPPAPNRGSWVQPSSWAAFQRGRESLVFELAERGVSRTSIWGWAGLLGAGLRKGGCPARVIYFPSSCLSQISPFLENHKACDLEHTLLIITH